MGAENPDGLDPDDRDQEPQDVAERADEDPGLNADHLQVGGGPPAWPEARDAALIDLEFLREQPLELPLLLADDRPIENEEGGAGDQG